MRVRWFVIALGLLWTACVHSEKNGSNQQTDSSRITNGSDIAGTKNSTKNFNLTNLDEGNNNATGKNLSSNSDGKNTTTASQINVTVTQNNTGSDKKNGNSNVSEAKPDAGNNVGTEPPPSHGSSNLDNDSRNASQNTQDSYAQLSDASNNSKKVDERNQTKPGSNPEVDSKNTSQSNVTSIQDRNNTNSDNSDLSNDGRSNITHRVVDINAGEKDGVPGQSNNKSSDVINNATDTGQSNKNGDSDSNDKNTDTKPTAVTIPLATSAVTRESMSSTPSGNTDKSASSVGSEQSTSSPTTQTKEGSQTRPSPTNPHTTVTTNNGISNPAQGASATTPLPKPFTFVYNKADSSKDPLLYRICSRLLQVLSQGNCSMFGKETHNGYRQFDKVIIHGEVNSSVVKGHYDELVKKPDEPRVTEESDYTTLIAILASCGAVVLIIMGLAVYTYRHGKNYRKNQQHLTEELQTVENGYHDNPTLEVMEVQPETATEKRPNGEFNDSWIVPIDNLLKEELPDEEDTHL